MVVFYIVVALKWLTNLFPVLFLLNFGVVENGFSSETNNCGFSSLTNHLSAVVWLNNEMSTKYARQHSRSIQTKPTLLLLLPTRKHALTCVLCNDWRCRRGIQIGRNIQRAYFESFIFLLVSRMFFHWSELIFEM